MDPVIYIFKDDTMIKVYRLRNVPSALWYKLINIYFIQPTHGCMICFRHSFIPNNNDIHPAHTFIINHKMYVLTIIVRTN